MRALSVVLLLCVAAPAAADTPPATQAPDAEVPPPAAQPPAIPIRPPALTRPAAGPDAATFLEEPAPLPQRYGYRWQIAAGDAAAIGMSVLIDRLADGGDRPGALATLTIASYFFTAPMIHGIHRRGKRALLSFALRAGLPLTLGLIGEQLDAPPKCDFCDDELRSDGKLAGLTIGVLLAMAIDTALLTRPIYKRVERPRTVWAPALRGVRGGATAGVLATF